MPELSERSKKWYEDGFAAFMDGKMAADNPWSNHAGAVASNYWFAGWLDAQWEILSKLKLTTGSGMPEEYRETVDAAISNLIAGMCAPKAKSMSGGGG